VHPDLSTLRADLETIPGFRHLQNSRKRTPLYLVGGALRDWALGRNSKDIDLATPGDPTAIAQDFASRCGGSWFWLDETRRHSRVVLQEDATAFSYDFGPLRAATIEEDLKQRDFTLNAIALELDPDTPRLIDPLGALNDLANGVLRQCGSESFASDPLRVLRGVRFVQQLGVLPDAETRANMTAHVSGLSRVAGERIQAELAVLLHHQGNNTFLPMMQQLGLFAELFGFSADLAKLEKQLQQLESAAKKARPWVIRLAESSLASGFSLRALLKLHLLMNAGGGQACRDATTQRLRLGRRCRRALSGLLSLQQTAYFPLPTNRRAQQLWYQALPGNPQTSLTALCLGPAAGLNSGIDPGRFNLRVTEEADWPPLAPLVSASRMIETLGFIPGPKVGAAIEALRRAEISEQVTSVAQAEEFLCQWQRNSH